MFRPLDEREIKFRATKQGLVILSALKELKEKFNIS